MRFEDPATLQGSKEARVASMKSMVRLKSHAFSNTEIEPTPVAAGLNDKSRFFPSKLPVGAKPRVTLAGHTSRFVSPTLPAVGAGTKQPKLQLKLPQILSLRQQLQKQEQEELAFLQEAEESFLTQARAELGETFYK